MSRQGKTEDRELYANRDEAFGLSRALRQYSFFLFPLAFRSLYRAEKRTGILLPYLSLQLP